MKRGWIVFLLLVGFAAPVVSHAQVSAYGEFSASRFFGPPTQQEYLYGVTAGVLIDGPLMAHKVLLSGDIQGRFLGKNGERSDGLTVGPRISFEIHKMKLSPFAEFLVGFARFNDGNNNSSTDGAIQMNGGVTRQLSPRWDAVVDYSYSQFYYNGGEFNPKTLSLGAVYHFVKR
jgi:Outer membrane protein beta-barrel domain